MENIKAEVPIKSMDWFTCLTWALTWQKDLDAWVSFLLLQGLFFHGYFSANSAFAGYANCYVLDEKTVNEKLEKLLFDSEHFESDAELIAEWKQRTSFICKPCWELRYCPYGPLVEDFPLLPTTKTEAEAHTSYIEECLKTGKLSDGKPLDEKRKKDFEKMVAFNSSRTLPEEIPQIFMDASCNVFGHMCPVFFVAEPFTETKETRRFGRYIPRDIMLKVVRRDGQICQECHNNVPDTEIEFDHIIPVSKGGPVSVDNLRVLCTKCNRKKSNSLNNMLQS